MSLLLIIACLSSSSLLVNFFKLFVVPAFGKFWVAVQFAMYRMQTVLAALAGRTFSRH